MPLSPKALALLEAHVQFTIKELTGKGFEQLVLDGLEEALVLAGQLRLKEVVSADAIKATARHYAVELELRAAVPEMVGAVSHAVHSSSLEQSATLKELLPARHLQEFVAKGLELVDLRQRIISDLTQNPLYANLLSDLALKGLRSWVDAHAPELLKNLLLRLDWQAELRHGLAHALTFAIRGAGDYLHQLDAVELRETVLDAWNQAGEEALASYLQYLTPVDLEDFFVITYEYWRDIRNSEFYIAAIDAGIDAFFAVYEEHTLAELLADIGITKDMMAADAMRFAPPIIKALKRRKMLEPLIRRRLERFYASGEAAALLT